MSEALSLPFDPTATLPENLIPDEPHQLEPATSGSNNFNFIVPKKAPFFKTGFKIKHVDSGHYLTEGIDFYFTHKLNVPSYVTDLEVYGSITFIDIGLSGRVVIESYRSLGGDFVLDEVTLLTILAKKDVDPRSVLWSDVVTPATFPPADHLDDGEDLTGMQALIEQIRCLEIALLGGSNNAHTHEIAHIRDLADQLASRASNKGPLKYNMGAPLNVIDHSGDIVLHVPPFLQDMDIAVCLGVMSGDGYGEIEVSASLQKDAVSYNTATTNAEGFYLTPYLSDTDGRFSIKKAVDVEENAEIFINVGRITNAILFIKSVKLNTTNSHIYNDNWGISLKASTGALEKALEARYGGSTKLDETQSGPLKHNTTWLVNSVAVRTRSLPTTAPDNSLIYVRDNVYMCSSAPASVTGKISIKNGQTVASLELDENGGWFCLQFKSATGTWHLIAGA